MAFEFVHGARGAVGTLKERLPDAIVVEDAAGLVATVAALARLVDEPDHDPDLALDIQGSSYEKQVWDLLREIPPGDTVTYGEIAARMGAPSDARDATAAIAANTLAILIPCHRVVKKDGSLSGYHWGYKRKRELLSREQGRRQFSLAS